jgi:flagellar biosynthesis protein FlhB
MYYFFFIIITIILCYMYKYYTILLVITILHVFISIILSYILTDQMVLFNWINCNIDKIEKIDSKFEIYSYTFCYWIINSLLIFLIIYMIIDNSKYYKIYNYLFYK